MANLRLNLLVFFLLLGSFAYFKHSEPGWNVNSRFALALALAETGSPVVDRYVTLPGLETRDLAQYAGHVYSDKSIGTSLLGVPAVWAVKAMESLADTTFSTGTRRWLVTLLSVGVAGAVSGVLLMHWLGRLWGRRTLDNSYFVIAMPPPAAVFTSVAVTLGSMLFLYGTLFMSYLPAHMFLLATLLTLEKALDGADEEDEIGAPRSRLGMFFVAGIFGGLCALCEYTYAAALVFLAVYLVHQFVSRRRDLDETGQEAAGSGRQAFLAFFLYGIGGLIGITPFIIYTLSIFGRLTIPYEYHLLPEFRQAMAQGFMGAGMPDLDVLWLITFHPFRGIFVYSPLLFLGFTGLIWLAVRSSSVRAAAIVCLACAVFYLLFNSAYYMWWGGWSFSPRHLAPAIPFMAAGLLPWFANRAGRLICVIAAAVGVIVHTLVNATEPQPADGGWQVALLRPDLAAFDYPVQFANTIGRIQEGVLDLNLGTVIGLPHNLLSVAPLLLFWGVMVWLISRIVRVDLSDS